MPIPAFENFSVEAIGPEMSAPWSLAFLPDGSFLISEKHGGVRIIRSDGQATEALSGGPPNVYQANDSGLLDILLDPDFIQNRTIYLAYVEGTSETNRLAIWRAVLGNDGLTGGVTIFRVNRDKSGPSHPGGRMAFLPDGTLLVSVGDGYDLAEQAQDPSSHFGKVLRLTRDGEAAHDNPFSGQPDYAPEVWTLGHRNIQGLIYDAERDEVWSHEHGPRGGDEMNLLTPGANYGWPAVTSGIDYDGTIISNFAHQARFARSHFFWAPSIAPSGLAIYRGNGHPDFEGHFLVGAMALSSRGLVTLRQGAETGLLVEQGRWLRGLDTRIRDVRVSSSGEIYLLTDGEGGRLLRLVPMAPATQ